MGIAGSFFNVARRYGGRVAVQTGAVEVTYDALADEVRRLSNVLKGYGVGPGDVVGGIMPNRSELVALDLACSASGFVRTLLNSRAPADDYVYCLNFAEAKVLVFDESLAEVIDGIRDRLNVEKYICVGKPTAWAGSYSELLASAASSFAPEAVQPATPHSIYFTSGTTGRPKGVLLSHANWIRIAYCHTAELDPGGGPDDVALLAAPMTHATGSLVVPCLLRGSRLLMMDHFDADQVNQYMATAGVTSTFMAPTMIQMLMQHVTRAQAERFRLRTLLYGGASFPTHRLQEALELFGPVLVQGYGQWESPIAFSYLGKQDHVDGLKHDQQILSSGGQAAMFADMAILDDEGRELPAGQEGEIAAAGPQLMIGYLKNPDATSEIRSGRWQRTGDVGYLDERGYVYITDRKKDMIITGGMNVYPRQVEEVLYQHPGVEEACVVGVPSELWGETVHAVVVCRDGSDLTGEALVDWSKDRLPNDRRPRSVNMVSSLPKNNYGKILRREVRDAARAELTAGAAAVSPQD